MKPAELYVTNFNLNFTGVSATTANVVVQQADYLNMHLVGEALPNCPRPLTKRQAYQLSKEKPDNKPFAIWHVRRNPEMRAAIWARDILRLPIKVAFTSAAQRLHSAYPRWLISKMDAVIATSQEAAGYVPHVMSVTPHGVDTEKFIRSINRARDWQSLGYGGKIGIATIGRVRPEKGTDIFVDSMLEVLPKNPDIVALVIGKASRQYRAFQQKLEHKIAAAGLSDRLIFTGEISATEMPKIMRAISLLVALPRYEGYGMTPLEALSCGTPFVASDTGYFKEFSYSGKVGEIVPLEASKQASEKIIEYLSKPEKYDAAVSASRDYVQNYHSIQREVEGIQSVYEMLWQQA